MDAAELIAQLRDIQPPPEPAWWQLSPLLIGLLLVGLAVIVGVVALHRWRRRNRLVELADAELKRIAARIATGEDDGELARSLGEWLKRVAMAAFPAREPGALVGEAWLRFLDRCAGRSIFENGPGRVFAAEIYAPGVPVSAAELLPLCEAWLRAVAPWLRRGGRPPC